MNTLKRKTNGMSGLDKSLGIAWVVSAVVGIAFLITTISYAGATQPGIPDRCLVSEDRGTSDYHPSRWRVATGDDSVDYYCSWNQTGYHRIQPTATPMPTPVVASGYTGTDDANYRPVHGVDATYGIGRPCRESNPDASDNCVWNAEHGWIVGDGTAVYQHDATAESEYQATRIASYHNSLTATAEATD